MPPPTQPLPLEPTLLAAFRQQGAAIVAHERGLSPACRIKLAGVARSLGIGDDQIEEAIRSLTAVEPSAPPNAEAERFRQRLRKDLAGKSRTIIGPTIEAQILASAKRKYRLEPAEAGDVLGEVATELGLTRITASDATQNLAAQIDQAVGDSTWLAREAWDRLRSAGCKWGLDLEVIDELIDERLTANRADYVRRSAQTRTTLFVAGGSVVAVCTVVAGLMLSRTPGSDYPRETPGGATLPDVSHTRGKPVLPAWWDVDLSVEMAHARSGLGGLIGACDLMASSSPVDRATGYERMLDQLRASPEKRELLAAISKIFAGCYGLEPDEAAAGRLRSALLSLLPASEAPLPASTAHWGLPFWAAESAAVALDRRGAKSDRLAALADALSSALGGAIDTSLRRPDRQRLVRERTVLAAYRQLAAAAIKQPSQVAALYPGLAQRAALSLPEEEMLRAETTFLITALPAAGDEWKVYERPLVRCIASPDPLPAMRLVDALRRADDPKLIAHLSQLLVARSGARPKSTEKKDVIAAVRQALGGESAGITAADRWLSLQDEVTGALSSLGTATDERELLKQAVILTHLTTLAMALAQGEPGFATFDAGLANPPQLAGPRSATDLIPGLASSGSAGSRLRLTKSQQRDLGQSLETLDKHGAGMQPQREAALRSLTALAGETADISPQQAQVLAHYLFAEKSAGEQAKAVAVLTELRHWNHLWLAVADQLLIAKLPFDQVRTIVGSLLGHEPDSSASIGELRRLLLTDVLEALKAASSAGGMSEALDQAADRLAQSYRQRAALWSASAGLIPAAASTAQGLEALLTALSASQGAKTDDADRLPRELTAARYLAGDDLHYTVAVQRLLVEASARRIASQKPQHAGAARQIAAEARAAGPSAPSVLAQLRDQEAALLKLWMLYAPEV